MSSRKSLLPAIKVLSLLGRFSDKYSPGDREARDIEIEKDWERLCMIEFSVTHLTGKQGIDCINNPVD